MLGIFHLEGYPSIDITVLKEHFEALLSVCKHPKVLLARLFAASNPRLTPPKKVILCKAEAL